MKDLFCRETSPVSRVISRESKRTLFEKDGE
jgi:hypothetical protein